MDNTAAFLHAHMPTCALALMSGLFSYGAAAYLHVCTYILAWPGSCTCLTLRTGKPGTES